MWKIDINPTQDLVSLMNSSYTLHEGLGVNHPKMEERWYPTNLKTYQTDDPRESDTEIAKTYGMPSYYEIIDERRRLREVRRVKEEKRRLRLVHSQSQEKVVRPKRPIFESDKEFRKRKFKEDAAIFKVLYRGGEYQKALVVINDMWDDHDIYLLGKIKLQKKMLKLRRICRRLSTIDAILGEAQ